MVVPSDQTSRVHGGNLPIEVNRTVQQEVGIASDTLVVDIHEVSYRAHLMVLTVMVEPPWANAHIHLTW